MLKEIAQLATKFNDVEEVKAELKRIQSVKCRLMKQKALPDYENKMAATVSYEQALKEVRMMFEPKKTVVTTMTLEDIKLLNYDETMKAIKSIQSKKCNTQHIQADITTNVEYQSALQIEKMLLEHKKTVKPIEETVIKKSTINDLLAELQNLDDKVSKEYIEQQLKKLLGQ